MKAVFNFTVLAVATFLLGACTAGNFNSIHRTFDLESNKSQLVDVKQRTILVSRDPQSGSAGGRNHSNSRPRVCAEPSPDAISSYVSVLSGEGKGADGSSLSATLSSTEQALAFGLRTQSIQLMRDAYYRACEAHLSDAIDDETYEVLLRRLNSQAIAYLAIEAISSGAAKSSQPSGKAPDAESAAKSVIGARSSLKSAEVDLAKKKADLAKVPDADSAAKTKASGEVTNAEKKVAEAKKAEEAELKKLEEVLKPGAASADAKDSGGGVSVAAVNAIEKIASAIVNFDHTGQMCFVRLKKSSSNDNAALSEYCEAVLTTELRSLNAMAAYADFVKSKCDNKDSDECSRLFEKLSDSRRDANSGIRVQHTPNGQLTH